MGKNDVRLGLMGRKRDGYVLQRSKKVRLGGFFRG